MTSGYTVTTGRGNVRALEYDWIFQPLQPRPTSRLGVVLVHGSDAPHQYVDVTTLGSGQLAAHLAWAGIPCIAAEMSGQAWANDASQVDISAAIDYLAEQTGVPDDQVLLVGTSMGGLTAIRYALDNPSRVAGVAGLIPLTDLVGFYATFGFTVGDQIATAWGVVHPAALPGDANVQARAADLTVPARLYYSPADGVVDPADTAAFAAASGADLVNIGAHGHSDASMLDVIAQGGGGAADLIAFLTENGA